MGRGTAGKVVTIYGNYSWVKFRVIGTQPFCLRRDKELVISAKKVGSRFKVS
jgi:hypothetical protein